MRNFTVITGLIMTSLFAPCSPLLGAGLDSLLPKPLKAHATRSQFTLKGDALKLTRAAPEEAYIALDYLQLRLQCIGIDLLAENENSELGQLTLVKDESLAAEAYKLAIGHGGISLTASTSSGFLYATMTLLQLCPDEVWNTEPKPVRLSIAGAIVEDAPRFGLRGLMLDVSRQFYPKAFILELLDLMAQHKLNTFHWHLSDDEGWRIEIKKFPKLTQVGSVRGPGTALPFEVIPAIHGPKDTIQSGFYTQEDIREVVAHAQALGISIIPEIDIPGHCKAAIVSYPDLLQDPQDASRYRSVQGTPNNTIDAGLDSTYEFLDGVFAEVAALFPGEFIHVGGDERPAGAWEKSPAAQAMMKREGLKDTDELQSYFFRRVEAILAKYDKRMLGWQEAAYGGKFEQKGSAIMAWHDVNRAMQEVGAESMDIILVPATHCYFDLKYERRDDEPGLVWAGTTDTRDAYSYQPIQPNFTEQQRNHILGLSSCLWSETVIFLERADYMLFPRLCAFAEVCWSSEDGRSWEEFNERLHARHLTRLDRQDVVYRVPPPSAQLTDQGLIITPPFPSAQVHFTLDGSDPDRDSPLYTAPIHLSLGDQPRFATMTQAGRLSRIVSEYESPPAGRWNPELISNEFESVEFKISNLWRGAGTYQVKFNHEKGGNGIDIRKIELLADGEVLGQDEHIGFAGKSPKDALYRITTTENSTKGAVTLRVTLRGAGGRDSYGRIDLSHSPNQPKFELSSHPAPAEGSLLEFATDGDPATAFRANHAAREEDQIAITFEEKESASEAFVRTGTRDGKDQLVAGRLEFSTDGTTWQSLAEIQFGDASAHLPEDTLIKALRLRVTQNQESPLVIREMGLK